MYVEPSTDVYILKNCPLESNYEHTVIFDSKEAQENYFLSLAKFHPTAGDEHKRATYQRVNLNALKIELPVEKLYDCNYMMFKNEYFENKWFYAFITSVEYVNNRTSLINYYIDVMQTWFFEAELRQCFVEREHVTDDRIGANTVPETLDMGDSMIYHYMDKADYFSWERGAGEMGDYYIEVITAFDNNGNKNASDAGLYGGVYSGLNYLYFKTISLANDYMNAVVSQSGEDAVIAVYMVPKVITTKRDDPISRHTWIADVSYASNWKYIWENDIKSPKNNKLYTYPFTAIICNNMIGGTIEYRVEDLCWEATDGTDENGDIVWVDKEKYLDTKKEKFYYTIEGISGAPPKCLMMPSHYGGQENARNQQLTIDSFPQCAFITDSYRAWVAMNYRAYNVAGIGSLISGGLGALSSLAGRNVTGITSNIVGTGTTIAELLAEKEKAKILPNREHGMTAPDLAMANDSLGFRFYCAHIRPEIAKRIDDYFDRYGYQVNVNKIPNRKARKHWSYVKTADCTLVGDLPDDDKQKIIAVYNRGITFWSNPEEVGNYTLDNNEGVLKEATSEPEWEEDDPFVEDVSIGAGGVKFHDDVVTEEDRIDNAFAIYTFLKKRGWTNGAIIGLIANIDYYSDLDPSFMKNDRFGFLLWDTSRQKDLFRWMDSQNPPYAHNSGAGQLLYIDTMSEADGQWEEKAPYGDVDFDTFKNAPSWGDGVESAKCFYCNYMRGSSEYRQEKITELAEQWQEKLSSSKTYQPDSTDQQKDSTKPNSGTGSSSNNKSTPNPSFYASRGEDALTTAQIQSNAKGIRSVLKALDWSDNAIYAVLGNWEVTSGLNPLSHYIKPELSTYDPPDPLGFAHWSNDRLEALTTYLIKYNYIHWPSTDDIPDEWIDSIPSSIRDVIRAEDWDYTAPMNCVTPYRLFFLSNDSNGGYGKGMIMYLHDKGSGSREWVKTDGHNMTFSAFKKSTKDVATLTEIFDYNYMRNKHSAEDTRLRKTMATKWELYFSSKS